MRKILVSLFLINILLSFFIFYDLENNSINERISKSGEDQNFTIFVDKGINELERNKTIDKIQKVTKKYEADVIFRVYNNAPSQKLKLVKFVYLKDSEQLFKDIRVKGNVIDNYDTSMSYLDTGNIDNGQQVGSILVMDPDIYFKIATFENLKESKYTLSGFYSVNINKSMVEAFISELKGELGINVTLEKNFNNNRVVIPPILKIIPMIIVFLLSVLVVVFDLISKYKDIGVKKLNGYSENSLKLEYYKGICWLYLISTIISYSILGILYIKFRNILYVELVFKSLIVTGILFLLICLILLISLNFIRRIKMSSAIKNKKPVHIVKRFSIVFKFIFTFILIGLFISGLKLYVPVYSFYFENFKKWEAAIDYAQVDSHYYNENEDFDERIWSLIQHKKLYFYVNEMGGIQVLINDFYQSNNSDPKKREEENIIENTVLLNNNYLKKHPVYDLNGKVVSIDENECVHTFLVPEKYAYLEEQIIKTYENYYISFHDIPKELAEDIKRVQLVLNEKEPELFGNEPDTIKIIVIKNDQGYFTYDMNVHPESKNMVYDRIIDINTKGAYKNGDISTNLGYFIKVENPEEPFLSISDKVKELGLEAYYYDAYSAYSNVAEQVNMYLGILSQILVIFGIAGVTIAILIAYSIMIYMEKEKMDLSVKLLNGYSFIGRHGRKLLRTILFYIFFLPSFLFVRGNATETMALALLLVGIVILDLLLTYIFISIYEKRNIKDILKGN
ncbi:MAG: Bacteriocin-associated integral membrane protein [Fusobacteria bacterium]|nr:MAG: Bacteriocin-associated integral membrane protein [Fusobacteriota bacterium]KAF0228497.1 MAG: Bacteriocin-associated integral membrane [Fusobacteriota bacterium]